MSDGWAHVIRFLKDGTMQPVRYHLMKYHRQCEQAPTCLWQALLPANRGPRDGPNLDRLIGNVMATMVKKAFDTDSKHLVKMDQLLNIGGEWHFV